MEPYLAQCARWPARGRHVMAQFDEDTVVVYQAYRPSIGRFASENGFFGGEFSLSRMSWVKPNFLWMMYRSGWGSKDGQEVVLAVWLKRTAFDQILEAAVPSSHDTRRWADRTEWQTAVAASDVRLQWDPDHGPSGAPLERRAVQIGLRGPWLAKYARPWIVAIEDVSEVCREQHTRWRKGGDGDLVMPREDVYPVTPGGAASLGSD